nr:immunoglobulin heavy chain junction region [Mus musculus]
CARHGGYDERFAYW